MKQNSKSETQRWGKNGVLNKPGFESIAAYSYTITYSESERWADRDPLFYISDCSNSISLSFDISSEEEADNSINKIDTLIAGLTEFKKDLLDYKQTYDDLQRRRNSDSKSDK